jgi:hypothetical protein
MFPEDPPSNVKNPTGAWGLVVAGYSMTAAALVAFLTINGASGVSSAVTIGTAGLVVVGLLLPTAGLLWLRGGLGEIERAARYGFSMQSFGLVTLLFGVVIVQEVPTLQGYFVSAALVVTAGVFAIVGTVLTRGHYMGIAASNALGVGCLTLGTALIFAGVGLIVGSNIAYEYLISQVENTIYVDVGATISACGCVLAAYSFFILHSRGGEVLT